IFQVCVCFWKRLRVMTKSVHVCRAVSTSTHKKTMLLAEQDTQPSMWDRFGIWLDEPVILPPRLGNDGQTLKSGIGYASETGRRKQNEDHFSMAKVSDSLFLFAIFDGHGGAATAEFCARNFGHFIQRNLQMDSDLESVLMKAFLQIDHTFLHNVFGLGEDKALTSGTTATVVLLENETELIVANVGDSPAVLCREGKAERLTEDHTPRRKDEKHRIQQCGGFIQWNSAGEPYVNGRLAMTRSIGDVQVKPFGVIAQPEISRVKLQNSKDSFLIMATDGISGIMEDQEMCDIVKRCQDPAEAARLLTDQALQYGTQDNVTSVVIPFDAWGKYKNALTSSSFGRLMVASCRWV
uniref:protein-serine/threonine phosphatase n=1 Tax=Latimeria chalumnae TaxID=7897 RepID=H3AB05_LATCH